MATTAEGQQRLVIPGCGAYTMEKGGNDAFPWGAWPRDAVVDTRK